MSAPEAAGVGPTRHEVIVDLASLRLAVSAHACTLPAKKLHLGPPFSAGTLSVHDDAAGQDQPLSFTETDIPANGTSNRALPGRVGHFGGPCRHVHCARCVCHSPMVAFPVPVTEWSQASMAAKRASIGEVKGKARYTGRRQGIAEGIQ
jgi:hypothetical protein